LLLKGLRKRKKENLQSNIRTFSQSKTLFFKMNFPPEGEEGSLIALQKFCNSRKSFLRYLVIATAFLKEIDTSSGVPVHGIQWPIEVFENLSEAQEFAQEVLRETSIGSVRILPLGKHSLLTPGVSDPTVVHVGMKDEVLNKLESESTKRRLEKQKVAQSASKSLTEESERRTIPGSIENFSDLAIRYIQNRGARIHFEKKASEIGQLEEQRRAELHTLLQEHPEYRDSWISSYKEYRRKTGQPTDPQVETEWEAVQDSI
jgi:hypothetical protein